MSSPPWARQRKIWIDQVEGVLFVELRGGLAHRGFSAPAGGG